MLDDVRIKGDHFCLLSSIRLLTCLQMIGTSDYIVYETGMRNLIERIMRIKR